MIFDVQKSHSHSQNMAFLALQYHRLYSVMLSYHSLTIKDWFSGDLITCQSKFFYIPTNLLNQSFHFHGCLLPATCATLLPSLTPSLQTSLAKSTYHILGCTIRRNSEQIQELRGKSCEFDQNVVPLSDEVPVSCFPMKLGLFSAK